jgi:2-Cys peroxiredoxin 5
MRAWSIDQKLEGSNMIFMGDPAGEVTKAFGMELTHPGPISKGIIGRCKRFSMYVVNSVVKYVAVSEAENDPAGDDDPSITCHEAMLEAIAAIKESALVEESSRVEEPSRILRG